MARNEQAWLHEARVRILHGDFGAAESLLAAALSEHPRSFELRRLLAGIYQQTARTGPAESLLRELLHERPQDFASAFTLARLLLSQARGHAAAQALRQCFEHGERDPELAIKAIELLDEADRKHEAEAIAEMALEATPTDARLHAYAGMLRLQLGRFEEARTNYLFALDHSPEACEWHVPHGLASAQRYTDAAHPDFILFRDLLRRPDLSGRARSSLMFALGKAYDDVGAWREAADCFRQGNASARGLMSWSRNNWRIDVQARLTASQIKARSTATDDFVPVFIIGMPRSGTTLLAELLGRLPRVRNRGELPWIGELAQLPEFRNSPDAPALQQAEALYRAQTRQDDSGDARWFIDKQPMNFRYVDLMLAMFPNARIIWCRRGPRDTALSLWMQSFKEDLHGYAYDFGDIDEVMRGCDRLMAKWCGAHPHSIRAIHYETLVANPDRILMETSQWLGLPSAQPAPAQTSSIGTSSLWQARQPVYSRSVGRWRTYSTYVPELLDFPESGPSGSEVDPQLFGNSM
jgi:tetratricopeptide (TPR) repeat protein